MRVIKNKKKNTAPNGNSKGNVWGGPSSNNVGGNIFSTGKKVAPGRTIKPLDGPVHPGFEKSAEIYLKNKRSTSSLSSLVPTLQKVDHSNDLYSPTKPKPKSAKTTKSKPGKNKRRK